MTREIKYRGKRLDTGEWVSGYPFYDSAAGILIQPPVFKVINGFSVPYRLYPVNPESVGQFSGFCDKNKSEIFEGAVVRAPLFDPIFKDTISDRFCNAVIGFNLGSFVVQYYGGAYNVYLSDIADRLEVIGNVIDNSDLLEESK